jgi:hypothetical protein
MRKLSLLCSLSLTAVLAHGATLTVNTVDNNNSEPQKLSLKQALAQAGAGDTIAFNIPGAGPHVIATPDEGYPFIAVNNLTIDGYTQPGAAPNSNSILAANNAQIKIVIDSSTGPGQRTLLGPLGNPGFGDGESAIFAVNNAANFKARGLAFRSRVTTEEDDDPGIYCFAFIDAATGGHISGCWFGLDPDGTRNGGGRSSVASFKGTGGVASTGMIIGTNGDGVDDRAEFNVHVGMGLAIHLETPDVRVSGNFINIMPDGKTIPPRDEMGEAIENGAGANMLIGTDGNGVADADERNIFGSVNYEVIVEFWRPGATNVVFAGNYVGVNTDGSATVDNTSSLFALRKQSNVRIGTDGDGVSDALENNWIYKLGEGSLIRWHGSNRDAEGIDAAKVVLRGNRFSGNGFQNLPFTDGVPISYGAYYQSSIADAANVTQFAPVLAKTPTLLTGTFAAATPEYPVATLDFYAVDPDAFALGGNHPFRKLATLRDNALGDTDPLPNQFSIKLTDLGLTGAEKVIAAVTYSKTAVTEATEAVTSPFSAVIDLAPAVASTLVVTTADNANTDVNKLSLKQALERAVAGDTITFNIPGAGPHVIKTPDEGYPFITADNLTINGYSQPGATPNTNPILGANNAQIKIVLDSTEGPGQRTGLGSLNNPGYGASESAILAVYNAKHFKATGLSFLSRMTAEEDDDAAIYCVAFIDAATGGQLSGNWFGVAPDGTTIAGGRASVASFKGQGGSASSGMIIGTNGDGADDRAEFNVHCGMGLAIHLETPDVRVSGNFINVLPDGKTILPRDEVGEAIENGAGANMLIGTDGNGVADADERNIFGSVNYEVIVEFWRPGATNVIFAGNYVGINTDGSATVDNTSSLFALRKQSNVRIGTDGDGVSDALENNWFYKLGEGSLIRWHGSNRDAEGVDAAKVVLRGNRFSGNGFQNLPFTDGVPISYGAYYQAFIADAATRTEFAPTLVKTASALTGSFGPPTAAYPVATVDFYAADPIALAAGASHPHRLLLSVQDNGAGDTDAAVGQFSVSLASLGLTATDSVIAAVTYSKTAMTEAGESVTSPFSTAVEVVPTAEIRLAITAQTAGTLTLSWTGASGKVLVQKKADIAAPNWFNVVSTTESSAVVLKNGDAGYFRIVGNYAGPDVTQLTAFLNGEGEKQGSPVVTVATGFGELSLEGTKLNYLVSYRGLQSAPTAAHIHGPFDSQTSGGVMKGFNTPVGANGHITGSVDLDATQSGQVLNGLGYVNIHTANNAPGEIRGQVLRTKYTAALNGANERPTPVVTDATGSATAMIYGNELSWNVSWNNLGSSATAGHFHLPALESGTAGPAIVFTGMTGVSGTTSGSQAVGQTVLGAFADGKVYANIHSVNNGGGEIRGQMKP